MKLLTKGCPRCQGDLSRVVDVGETYYSCVQCGHVASDEASAAPRRLSIAPPVPRAA